MINKIIEIVYKTKDIILNEYNKVKIDEKNKFDYVTNVDLSVSNFLKDILEREYPNYQFMDEENNNKILDFSKPTWILDPIDGTTNLIHNLNHSAVSLALVQNNQVLIGVVYNPFLDEMYYAEKNKGAFLNGKQIKVSDAQDLEHSLIFIGTNPYNRTNINERFKMFAKLFSKCQDLRRFGSAALDFCYVARGSVEGFFENNLKPWDMSAGVLILEEAGGKITDCFGNKIDVTKNSDIVATNGKIHEEILNVLNEWVGAGHDLPAN